MTKRQKREIKKGKEKFIDLSIYAKGFFNGAQISEIRQGLEQNVDVNIYTYPELTSKEMRCIRTCLKEGIPLDGCISDSSKEKIKRNEKEKYYEPKTFYWFNKKTFIKTTLDEYGNVLERRQF